MNPQNQRPAKDPMKSTISNSLLVGIIPFSIYCLLTSSYHLDNNVPVSERGVCLHLVTFFPVAVRIFIAWTGEENAYTSLK